MPIDPSKALGYELEAGEASWGPDQVILYHLGVGAGDPPTDGNELEYTYEKNLKVLPSYGVIPVFSSLGGLAKVPGLEFNFALLLHGEQDIRIHKPLPTQATVTSKAKVAELWDKGKACLAVLEVETSEKESGDLLFTNRFGIFLRGEGGFGGEKGPDAGNAPPERDPDGVVERTTLPQQALLYRLSGDKNPLHADPEFAKMGGFDRPIIHGLCSYGLVCKAVVDDALGGDVTKVARYQARFRGVAFPGETYVVKYWREGDQIVLTAESKDRDGAPIISNAAITVNA